MAARGQALLGRIEALSVPTVAAIDGFALGGGLELALACDYRVAAESYERTLGLPEVQLGIHPGFGGSVRSVHLLGAPRALDLMLTGKSLSPREALECGLIDRVVPREALRGAAKDLVARRPPLRRAPWYLSCSTYSRCGGSWLREFGRASPSVRVPSTIRRPMRSSSCGSDGARTAMKRCERRPRRSASCSSRRRAAISFECSSCGNVYAISHPRKAQYAAFTSWARARWAATSRPGVR